MTRALGEQIEALVAGELAPEAAERVLAAIATSDEAAAELEACLQLRAIGHALGAGRVLDLGRARAGRRRRWPRWIALAAPIAAAAAVALYVVVRRAPPARDPDARFIAALSAHRQLEPRLSWPSADRHRPYDPVRAQAQRVEALPLELLVTIERMHDARAAAAAALLAGNSGAAAAELARAPETPDVLSDRAAVALVQGDPELAIIATAAALARAPTHPQARWNRALALHALGLDRSAAAVFDAVSAGGEPGWSDEAHHQASALHVWRTHHDAAWRQVTAAAAAMVRGGPPPVEQVAAFSSVVRGYFYDAVRAAPSAERVRSLAPLADALDAAAGGDVLGRYVARIAAAPFGRRGELAARYAALVRDPLDGARRAALIRDLRAAHRDDLRGDLLDDLVLGALEAGGHGTAAADSEAAAEYVRLADATRDPWFELAAAEQRGHAAAVRGDLATAESTLRDAGERCDRSGLAYRCVTIWRRLTGIYQTTKRPAAARDALAHARRAATAAGAVPVEDELLDHASVDAGLRPGRTAGGDALVAAYLDELRRARDP